MARPPIPNLRGDPSGAADVLRIFFANVSSWGPQAEKFFDDCRRWYDVIAMAETHLVQSAFLKLLPSFEKWGGDPSMAMLFLRIGP